jgi:hypothetical protein
MVVYWCHWIDCVVYYKSNKRERVYSFIYLFIVVCLISIIVFCLWISCRWDISISCSRHISDRSFKIGWYGFHHWYSRFFKKSQNLHILWIVWFQSNDHQYSDCVNVWISQLQEIHFGGISVLIFVLIMIILPYEWGKGCFP